MDDFVKECEALVSKHHGAAAQAVVLVRTPEGSFQLTTVKANEIDRIGIIAVGGTIAKVQLERALPTKPSNVVVETKK